MPNSKLIFFDNIQNSLDAIYSKIKDCKNFDIQMIVAPYMLSISGIYQLAPNVIVTNLYFQQRTIQEAINTLNHIRRITSTTNIKVIIVTECNNTAVYQYALLSGIQGYICTESGREINLSRTIENMIRGPRIKPSHNWLTLKEWMVCHSLFTLPNVTSPERAKALKMSVATYYRLLKKAQIKIGAGSTLELALKFTSPATALVA